MLLWQTKEDKLNEIWRNYAKLKRILTQCNRENYKDNAKKGTLKTEHLNSK